MFKKVWNTIVGCTLTLAVGVAMSIILFTPDKYSDIGCDIADVLFKLGEIIEGWYL